MANIETKVFFNVFMYTDYTLCSLYFMDDGNGFRKKRIVFFLIKDIQ